MSLHRQCPVVGDVHMIVGENVGVEYGIVWDPQFSEAWSSGTPGGISGETRLLGQTGIFPSRLDAVNLGGYHATACRCNVTIFRGRVLKSFHMIAECFEDPQLPSMWSSHIDFMEKHKTYEQVVVQTIDISQDGLKLAPISHLLCRLGGGESVWHSRDLSV